MLVLPDKAELLLIDRLEVVIPLTPVVIGGC